MGTRPCCSWNDRIGFRFYRRTNQRAAEWARNEIRHSWTPCLFIAAIVEEEGKKTDRTQWIMNLSAGMQSAETCHPLVRPQTQGSHLRAQVQGRMCGNFVIKMMNFLGQLKVNFVNYSICYWSDLVTWQLLNSSLLQLTDFTSNSLNFRRFNQKYKFIKILLIEF